MPEIERKAHNIMIEPKARTAGGRRGRWTENVSGPLESAWYVTKFAPYQVPKLIVIRKHILQEDEEDDEEKP